MNHLKEVIAHYRKLLGLSQGQAAEKAGISRVHWQRIENGKAGCPKRTARSILQSMGLAQFPPVEREKRLMNFRSTIGRDARNIRVGKFRSGAIKLFAQDAERGIRSSKTSTSRILSGHFKPAVVGNSRKHDETEQ